MISTRGRFDSLHLRRALAGVIAFALTVSLGAQARPTEAWPSLTSDLLHAADNGNVAALKAARAAALAVVVQPRADVPPTLALYTVAYADYRLAVHANTTDAERQGFTSEAETDLRDALAANPKFAEADGLLSAVIGLEIQQAGSIDAKMSLGPEATAALARGLSLDPDNPRLLIVEGIGLLKRPTDYGGDPKQAEAIFRRATALLDAAAPSSWPNWGRFDAHMWLGQTLDLRGDAAGARAEYAKALAIAPDSAWAKASAGR